MLIGEGALALGGAAVGVVFLVKRGKASDRATTLRQTLANDACDPSRPGTPPPSCGDLQDALGEQRTDGTIAAAGFITGGVGVAAVAVTWLLWPKARAKHSILLTPLPGGAAIRGVF